jgi:hypothetical protein
MWKTTALLTGYLVAALGLAAMAAEPALVHDSFDSDSSCCAPGRSGRHPCWCPMPLGACLRANINAQIDNGTAASLVLYRCDFCDACSPTNFKLNAHGQRRLSRMAGLMQHCGFHPLLIETSSRPELDTARRNYVLNVLEGLGYPSPAEWVVVGRPDFPMLSGEEGILIHEAMLNQTKQGGGGAAAANGAGGAIPVVPIAGAAPTAQ